MIWTVVTERISTNYPLHKNSDMSSLQRATLGACLFLDEEMAELAGSSVFEQALS